MDTTSFVAGIAFGLFLASVMAIVVGKYGARFRRDNQNGNSR
jgi:hypothetical protein